MNKLYHCYLSILDNWVGYMIMLAQHLHASNLRYKLSIYMLVTVISSLLYEEVWWIFL